MRLLHVPLKLQKTLHLTNSEDYAQLHKDITDWEEGCTEDSTDKVKAMYARLHKGPFARVFMPFAYFFLLRWVREMTEEPKDDFLDD